MAGEAGWHRVSWRAFNLPRITSEGTHTVVLLNPEKASFTAARVLPVLVRQTGLYCAGDSHQWVLCNRTRWPAWCWWGHGHCVHDAGVGGWWVVWVLNDCQRAVSSAWGTEQERGWKWKVSRTLSPEHGRTEHTGDDPTGGSAERFCTSHYMFQDCWRKLEHHKRFTYGMETVWFSFFVSLGIFFFTFLEQFQIFLVVDSQKKMQTPHRKYPVPT